LAGRCKGGIVLGDVMVGSKKGWALWQF